MELSLAQKKALAMAAARKRVSETAQAPAAANNMTVQPDLGFVPGVGPLLRMAGYDGVPKEQQPGYEPSSVPILDPINAFANKALESVPIAGPMLSGAARKLDEMTYGEEPGTREKINAGDQAQYRNAAVAGEVAGTAGPFVAAGGTALGARLLGMSGSLPARALLGGGTSAAITGADALVRGDSWDEAKKKAAMGGALGAALPVAERLAGVVVRAVTGKALQPAESALAAALEADGISLTDLSRRIDELGPEAVLADLGPNLQRLAGALASLPGRAQQTVREALQTRAAGTNRRIIDDTNDILGPSVVPSQVEAQIQQGMDALGPEYQAAFRSARAVDTEALALDLDSQIVNLRGDAQRAVRDVRRMLDVEGAPGNLDPNPFTLFQTRQAIDGLLETETNTKVIGALTNARRQVDTMLADAVPGIKQVDAKFEELARQRTALGRGQQTLDSGRTAVRPQELDAEMAAGAVPERGVGPSAVPFRLSQGARAEIERIIGTTANDLNALKTALKGDGSWNRDRLVTLFGQEKADRLLRVLDREKQFAATDQIVTKNSETAARQAMQNEVEFSEPTRLGNTTLTGLALMGGQKLANAGARFRRSGTNARLAEALMGPGNFAPSQARAIEDALRARRRRSIVAPAAVSQALMGPGSPLGQ